MPIRREPRSPGSHSIPRGNYRAIVKQSGGPDQPVTIAYLEYAAGNPGPLGWRPDPENTLVARTLEGNAAPNLSEGKRIASDTLNRLVSGELIVEKEPFSPPVAPERITELSHPQKPLKAIIVRWPDAYEVRTIGYVRDGFTLPAQTPSISEDRDYGWGRLDLFERLLADTEEEAIAAAHEELERLSHQDIPFKESSIG